MKKRVLFVAYNAFNRGGIQNVVMNIVKNLSNEYTFDLLCFQEDNGELENEFLSYGGKVIKYQAYYSGKNRFRERADYYLRGISLFSSTLKAIRENGPYQAIHCNNAKESGICLLAARMKKIPVRIAHSHTNFPNTENIIRRMLDCFYDKLININATYLVGCSEEAAENMFGKNNEKVLVINNGVDMEKYNPKRFSLSTRTDGTLRLLQIATFSNNKNQIFSLHILETVLKKGVNATITFVGRSSDDESNKYLDDMKKYIEDNKLSRSVSFLPSDTDIPRVIAENDIVLVPSKCEGFPLVPIEAQAMGKCCYASDTVPSTVNCGGCKFLPLGFGEEAWAEAIVNDFLESANRNNEFNCTPFDWSNLAQKYKELYQ